VQLFYSGSEQFYWAPAIEGTEMYRSKVVHKVEPKTSQFAGKSVIVTNETYYPELARRLRMKRAFISLKDITKRDLERVYGLVLRDARRS